jgi:xylonate dehydratase
MFVDRDLFAGAARTVARHGARRPDPAVPADTRLWLAHQNATGRAWRGSVYDVDRIVRVIEAGLRALNS